MSCQSKIITGDCITILRNSYNLEVDLVFADPPFNIGVDYGVHKDKMTLAQYSQFTCDWIECCVSKLRPNGSIWANVPDQIAAEVVMELKRHGMTMVNWCIWHFRFGQHRRGNFIVSKTHALYFCADPKNRIWNPDDIAEPSDRASVYGDKRTQSTKSPGERVPLDVWYGPGWGRVQGNNKERRKLHPNQLPEVYLERVIKACTVPFSTVLDPFAGSGTTCVVAKALGRSSIGIEIDPDLAESARSRLASGAARVSLEC